MNDVITLDYGSGGLKTSRFIEQKLLPAFGSPELSRLSDGAEIKGAERLVFTTDSFVVEPIVFPGGDVGKLSVCGTVNDLLVSGARPMYLSLAFIIEEGFPMRDMERIIDSIAETARLAGVSIVTGDTKVVGRGKADGVFINTSGIGYLEHTGLSRDAIKDGDLVLVSGNIGDHATAVMLARGELGLSGDISSDCAPLNRQSAAVLSSGGARVLRDPTRGGLATTLNEFVEGSRYSIELDPDAIPVSTGVRAASELLGIDPLYSACEGRLVAVMEPESAKKAVGELRRLKGSEDASIIGRVTDKRAGFVTIKTEFGGSRVVSKLTGAQLPRIC